MKKVMMILGFLIAFIGLTTVFIVDETEQVVILQFGKPVRTITQPGINFKVPFPIQEKIVFVRLPAVGPPGKILGKHAFCSTSRSWTCGENIG